MEEKEIHLYSEEVQDILSRPPKSIFRWGNTILFGFIVLLLLFSWLIKYPDVVAAPAVITTDKSPVYLSPTINDKIDSIFFKDKSKVVSGDWLILIGNDTNINHVKKLDSILTAIKHNNYDLATIKQLNLPILNVGSIQTPYNNFIRASKNYSYQHEDNSFSNQAAYNKMQLTENERLINSAKRDLSIAEKELFLAENNYNIQQKLFEKGVIARIELEEYELMHLQAKRNLENQKAQIHRLKNQKATLYSQKTTLDRNESETKLAVDLTIIETIKLLETALQEWKKTHLIISPISGKISFLENLRNNQIVQPNQNLLSVTPDFSNEDFYVHITLPMQNAGKVKKGQNANILLHTFPQSEFGMLETSIVDISTVPNESNYLVKAKLTNGLVSTYGKELSYSQNMTGSANIITKDLRLIERFFYQLRNLFENN